MKRTSHLFLLVPSLFLLASCQTTPKVDTITEEEAQAFIKENFLRGTDTFNKPTTESTVKWEITDNDQKENAMVIVTNYLGSTVTELKGEAKITSDRAQQYKDEVNDINAMKTPGFDAIIGMNWDIYENLYQSEQHRIHYSKLLYKKGPDDGLVIISQLESTKNLYTLIHTYKGSKDKKGGYESKFEASVYNSDTKLQYKVTIDFHY